LLFSACESTWMLLSLIFLWWRVFYPYFLHISLSTTLLFSL
jgi:hypothetical protein